MDASTTPSTKPAGNAGGGGSTKDFRQKYESFSTLLPIFDLGFNTFITLSILKILYTLLIVLQVLAGIAAIIGAFANGFDSGVASIVLVPLLLLLSLILTRMYLG